MNQIEFATIARKSINDPYVNRFVDEVLEVMKLEVLQSLATAEASAGAIKKSMLTVGANPKNYPSVGMAVANRLSNKTPAVQKQILSNAARPQFFSPKLRAFAQGTGIRLRSDDYVLNQVNVKTKFSFFNNTFADKVITVVSDRLSEIIVTKPSTNGQIAINKGLKFRLHEVKCLDETDPEFLGVDEIALGGVRVDDKKHTTKINQFAVRSFNDGDRKTYNPLKELASFDLTGNYPKSFAVFVALAEKDEGGFGGFLQELYEAVKAEVQVILTALGAAAGAAIGAAIGGATGTLVGGPIGTVIGVVSGLILGALIGWLAGLLQDDIFEPQVAAITLNSANDSFAGNSLVSPVLSFVYEDFGGKYRVRYSWEIRR
jgi:hypothetical protein